MRPASADMGPGEPGTARLTAPVIVKKVTVVAAGHHGGAWKVAYADFVTAMMAFFLLLWLLGATDEEQRQGLADYFAPTLVKTWEGAAGGTGLLSGDSLTAVDNYPHRQGQTGVMSMVIPRGTEPHRQADAKTTEALRARLEMRLMQDPKLRELARQIRMVQTVEGTRIDLVDHANFSMFALGTTAMTGDARRLLGVLAETLAPERGALAIRGHTDALPWRGGQAVNNWSLSAGRAEATRQHLIRFGIAPDRFSRIEGVADREPLVPDDAADPRNRRISITLAN